MSNSPRAKTDVLPRDHLRRKKIIKTASSGLVARIITIGVSLVMVPMAFHYLGKEQYGLWVAVSSLVAMLTFVDGGLGNAVINMIAHASSSNKKDIAKIVSTSFFSLILLATFGSFLFLIVFPYVSWSKLLGVADSTELSDDLNVVVMTVGLFFFLSIFITLVGKIQRGFQEGNLDNFWNAIGALLSLLLVYVAIKMDGGLIAFVLAFLSGPLITYIASNVHYLFFRKKELLPRFARVDSAIAKNLFSIGGMFFVLQIASTIQAQADNVIIANILGPSAVTNYAICMKLFLLVPMFFSLIMAPLWPAYREAYVSGDIKWINRVFVKSIRWALLISIPSAIVLIMIGANIIALWVGLDAVPSNGLLIGCGIWLVLMTVGNALGVFLNGLQLVKMQLIVAIFTLIMNIILSITLTEKIGVEGAIFGSIIAYSIFTIVPYFFYIKKVLKHS
jgi:O-antigen/teichoic acid export membrane protein